MTSLLSILAFAALIIPECNDANCRTQPPPCPWSDYWDCIGTVRGCTGATVSSNWFVAAAHIGAYKGDLFYIGGKAYPLVEGVPDTASDLMLWRVDGAPFKNYVGLYPESIYSYPCAFIAGAGCRRGDPVVAWCRTTNTLHRIVTQTLQVPYWLGGAQYQWCTTTRTTTNRVQVVETNGFIAGFAWGPRDGRIRWGTNDVEDVGNLFALPFGDTGVAVGDSSGPVFLELNGQWLLAGLLLSVSGNGPYCALPGSTPIVGSFWQFGGMYTPLTGYQFPCRDRFTTTGFATKINPRINWINSVIHKPL